MTGRRRLSRGRAALYAATVLLLLWGAAEAVLALAGSPGGPVYNLKSGIRWTVESNLRASPMRVVESGRTFSVSTNVDGLRTFAEPGPAPEGVSTVLMLGDSTIFGWGVDDTGDVPAGLERGLRSLGAKVRVVNGGQPGYSTLQSFLLLRDVGVRYEPDLVVVEFSMHNFRTSKDPDAQALDASGSTSADYFLAAHSRVYREVRRLVLLAAPPPTVKTRGGPIKEAGKPDPQARDVRVPPEDFRSTFEGAAALGREHGFRVALTWPPRDTRTMPPVYLQAAAALEKQGDIVVVDYSAAWEAAGGTARGVWLADDPGHYSASGAVVTGKALAARILEMKLLDR